MKKRLNILCLLVILVMGYSLVESAYWFSYGLKSSVNAGWNAGKKNDPTEIEKFANVKPIALVPDDFLLLTDSVLNEKTGKYVPMTYSQMIVSIKAEPNLWQLSLMTTMSIISPFIVLTAVIIFILLIVSINKSDIFNWRNVYRLRWLGGMLIFSFICSVVPMCITSNLLSNVFAVKGYTLNLSEFISITNLVLGLSALIVGEVFAIGLRMKEEQELTI